MTNTQVRVLITASNPEGFTLSDIAGRIISVMLAIVLVLAVTTFSLLFATQGFINEDVETKGLPAMMPQTNCPIGEDSCYDLSHPPDCRNASGTPFPCYKVSPLQLNCTPCP